MRIASNSPKRAVAAVMSGLLALGVAQAAPATLAFADTTDDLVVEATVPPAGEGETTDDVIVTEEVDEQSVPAQNSDAADVVVTTEDANDNNNSDNNNADKVDLSDAKITATAASQKYTGQALETTLFVTYKDDKGAKELKLDTDYKVKEYKDNTKIGTATVTIEAVETSDYKGTRDVQFKIVQADAPEVTYRANVKGSWQTAVTSGISGTEGQKKRLEGIAAKLGTSPYTGTLEYLSHVQSVGWESNWSSNDTPSGLPGSGKRIEAIRMRLTDELATNYDVWYRAHCQKVGWTGWASNGDPVGTAGAALRAEAYEIKILPKGSKAPGSTAGAYRSSVVYVARVQKNEWQKQVRNGSVAGTTGQALKMKGIRIALNSQWYKGSIMYRTHRQTYGWETDWSSDGQIAGQTPEGKRIEAIEIKLTDEMAQYYDVWYSAHCQKIGWTGWGCNGQSVGTEGLCRRLEAVKVVLVPKGFPAPGDTSNAFYKK